MGCQRLFMLVDPETGKRRQCLLRRAILKLGPGISDAEVRWTRRRDGESHKKPANDATFRIR